MEGSKKFFDLRLSFSLEWGPKYTGGHKFLERKIGGHKIFDDQNVGSHKMTTDGSGVAEAFPGGRVAHPEGQNEEENAKSLRKNK